MVSARIYSPAKTAAQSGKARTKDWVLEYNPVIPLNVNEETGWVGTKDPFGQIRLNFHTLEAAVAYAKARGIVTEVFLPHPRIQPKKNYSDNFR